MKRILIITGVLVVVMVGLVQADPGPYDAYFSTDPCDGTPDGIGTVCADTDLLNVVNYLLTNAGVASPFTTNEDLDAVQLNYNHSYWANTGVSGALGFVSVFSDGLNTPGIYEQGDPGSPILMTGHSGDLILGDGSVADPYPGLIHSLSNNFGVLIDHKDVSFPSTKYSDPTLNLNGYDQMLAFDLRSYLDGQTLWLDTDNDGIGDVEVVLQDTYLLAFEDHVLDASDYDFDDSILLLTRASPVPEPLTMTLFGTGLVGLALRKRK